MDSEIYQQLSPFQRAVLLRAERDELNRYRYDEDFQETVEEGSKRFGITFVHAQEAALGCFTGIYPQFSPNDFVMKGLVANIAFAVLSRLEQEEARKT